MFRGLGLYGAGDAGNRGGAGGVLLRHVELRRPEQLEIADHVVDVVLLHDQVISLDAGVTLGSAVNLDELTRLSVLHLQTHRFDIYSGLGYFAPSRHVCWDVAGPWVLWNLI